MEVGGLGMPLCCFPRVFLSSRSTWSSGRGGGASGCAFGARELASVSSVHSWTGDPGVALLRRTPATFLSRLVLPPHLCTLGEMVGLPSAAPVRVLPIFSLGSREGTLSPLLVKWLSCVVLLLTLSLRLLCSAQRSGRCGRGSSRLLFSLVRSLAVYGPLAVSQRSI